MAWKSREGLAPDAPHLCYTKVQPGLQYGSMYIELLVQSTRPSSRGISGLKFWVVSLGCILAQLRPKLPLCTYCLTLEAFRVNLCKGE